MEAMLFTLILGTARPELLHPGVARYLREARISR